MDPLLWVLAILCAMIFVACKCSNWVNYYVKFTIYIFFSMVCCSAFIPLMLFRPRDPRNALLPAITLRTVTRLLGVSYEVKGRENIVPKGQGCVTLINHQTGLDLLVLAHIWTEMPKSCVISKREVFWLWPFGLAVWLWGTVFIDRLNPEEAQGTLNSTGQHIVTKEARICMFPEGTRHMGETLLPFKKGAFHVALAAQCPIQPVVVSKYHFLDSKTHKFGSGRLTIEILPAIETKGLTKEQLPQLMDRVRNVMVNKFHQLSAHKKSD